eukprot:2009258-Lingulodinium_polyedra.AAC.1
MATRMGASLAGRSRPDDEGAAAVRERYHCPSMRVARCSTAQRGHGMLSPWSRWCSASEGCCRPTSGR